MKVARNRVVSIDYVIQLANGHVVESSTGEGALTYLHGRGQIVPGVERAIEGMQVGEVLQVTLPPSEGFGDRKSEGVFLLPRAAFPDGEEISTGMMFSATRVDGKVVMFRVLDAQPEAILVDTNHPLAGEVLHVWVAIRGIREATEEELARGRVEEAPPRPTVPLA